MIFEHGSTGRSSTWLEQSKPLEVVAIVPAVAREKAIGQTTGVCANEEICDDPPPAACRSAGQVRAEHQPARNALSRLEGTNWSCKSERNSSSSASLANDGASSARTHSEMSRAPSPAALRSAASEARAYPGSSTSKSSRTLVSIAVRTADLLQVLVHGPSLRQLPATSPLGESIRGYRLVPHQPAPDG